MREAPIDIAFQSRLAAQWAVFFERAGLAYRYRPTTFTLPSARRYVPDFHVPGVGWAMVSEDSSIYVALDDQPDRTPEQALVRESFSLFFEFASGCEEWCYWLGGVIPFWSISEVQAMLNFTLDDYADPACLHKGEFMRQEWPDGYRWHKLRRHDGPRRLPATAGACGGVLAQLHGAGHLKDSILDMEAFAVFNHKTALLAARSARL